MGESSNYKSVRLNTCPTINELSSLSIGDIVYLDGFVYTGREGVYMHVLEKGNKLPSKLTNLKKNT